MRTPHALLGTSAVALAIAVTPAAAEVMRSPVAFNNKIGEQTSEQPAGGVQVSYQVTLTGGDLDGCTVDIVETLRPHDEGAWGLFDIEGDVSCDGGGFAYTSSGAWDSNGFHAAGDIEEGSGSGDFEGISGRVAQLGGGLSAVDDGTFDVSYDLAFATEEG